MQYSYYYHYLDMTLAVAGANMLTPKACVDSVAPHIDREVYIDNKTACITEEAS